MQLIKLNCPECNAEITEYVNVETARRAGIANVEKHGKEHMKRIGELANAKRWKAVREARASKEPPLEVYE